MKIVLTHISPDFDAIASAYGVLKLHNCNHIALISNMEPNVYEYMKSGVELPIKRYSEKDIEALKVIDELYITDCKQRKRLGKLGDLIDKAQKVIVYDHHTSYAQDIAADYEVIKQIGSTSTIVTNLIRSSGLILNRFEATLLALGIYEDTGLLTFQSTTAEDAQAVAYLLSVGIDTSALGDFIKRDLNSSQVIILNELLLNLFIITVGDVQVAVSFASIDEYVDEVAYIAQRLMAMEGLESLFILISTGGRIVLVGRSRSTKVDASAIVKQFGGGGHISAASAVIKDMFMPEAVEKLKYVLREHIKPVKIVAEIMNAPVKYVASGTSFKKAMDVTMKYNLNHMPVMEKGRAIGIISRRDILHGIKHGFTTESVNDIMQVEFDKVTPTTPFYTAEEIMVTKGQKLLPVEDEKGLVGVVTRTDLLRLMHEEITLRSAQAEKAREDGFLAKSKIVSNLLSDSLPTEILELLKDIGNFAAERGIKAYVVGGFVRDLLMGNKNFDIDIVIEADATKFAQEFAVYKGAKAFIHSKFKTAMVILQDGLRIDFASSRTEYYMMPAAAPQVEEASIRNDLFRRDFTINAMAIRLDGNQYGRLLDFFSGQKDINEKKVRALHSLSFVDDPSRAFRAIRFAVRFSFDIGSQTERLIKHAESLNLFGQLVGNRLFLELKYILDEKGYVKALEMMKKYGLLRFYSPLLSLDEALIQKFEKLESLINWFEIQVGSPLEFWRVRFGVLFVNLKLEPFNEMLDKFDLTPKNKEELLEDKKYIHYAARLIKNNKNIAPSMAYKICFELSTEALLALACILDNSRQSVVKNYLTDYSKIKIDSTGDTLISLGIEKGPKIKETLILLKNAKLDGIIKTKNDEVDFIKKIVMEGETFNEPSK